MLTQSEINESKARIEAEIETLQAMRLEGNISSSNFESIVLARDLLREAAEAMDFELDPDGIERSEDRFQPEHRNY